MLGPGVLVFLGLGGVEGGDGEGRRGIGRQFFDLDLLEVYDGFRVPHL
jgi:hypothetical protein